MSKTATELRREYMKNWRKKNRDKVKQYNQAYWDRKAKKTTENNSQESRIEVNADEQKRILKIIDDLSKEGER